AITTFMSGRIKYYLLLDFMLMITFIGYTVSYFQMDVDQQLFNLGLLGKFNPNLFDPDKAFRMARLFTLGAGSEKIVDAIKNLYFTAFCAILFLNVYLKYPSKGNIWRSDAEIVSVDEYWNYARLRFFGGVLIFIIPALIAYFLTLFRFN
ncbi:MAG: hypothetical protein V1920_01890, partial [Bacillota bacterium]